MRRCLLLTFLLVGVLAAPASAAVTLRALPMPEGTGESDPITFEAENTDLTPVTVKTSDGTAKAPGDYDAISNQPLPPGTSTFEVQTNEDTAPEFDETLTVTADRTEGPDVNATGTIVDDDPPVLAVQDNTALERAGSVSVAVARSPISRPTTITWNVAGGSATAADLGATSGSITVPAGAAFGVITIPVVNDNDDEEDETVGIAIASSGATISRGSGTATITNDDVRTLSIADARVMEGDGDAGTIARVVVSLNAPTFRTVTMQWGTVDGTARAPADYLPRLGELRLVPGQAQATVDVPITSDDAVERPEVLGVLIGRQVGAALGDNAAVVTVTDDDAAQGDDTPPNMRVSKPRRRGNALTVRVSCPRNEQRCDGRATFFAAADRRSKSRLLRRERRLGRKSFRIAGGKATTLRLTVPRTIARAARSAGRLKVRAFVVTEDRNDNVDTTTASATLRFRR